MSKDSTPSIDRQKVLCISPNRTSSTNPTLCQPASFLNLQSIKSMPPAPPPPPATAPRSDCSPHSSTFTPTIPTSGTPITSITNASGSLTCSQVPSLGGCQPTDSAVVGSTARASHGLGLAVGLDARQEVSGCPLFIVPSVVPLTQHADCFHV